MCVCVRTANSDRVAYHIDVAVAARKMSSTIAVRFFFVFVCVVLLRVGWGLVGFWTRLCQWLCVLFVLAGDGDADDVIACVCVCVRAKRNSGRAK